MASHLNLRNIVQDRRNWVVASEDFIIQRNHQVECTTGDEISNAIHHLINSDNRFSIAPVKHFNIVVYGPCVRPSVDHIGYVYGPEVLQFVRSDTDAVAAVMTFGGAFYPLAGLSMGQLISPRTELLLDSIDYSIIVGDWSMSYQWGNTQPVKY